LGVKPHAVAVRLIIAPFSNVELILNLLDLHFKLPLLLIRRPKHQRSTQSLKRLDDKLILDLLQHNFAYLHPH